MTRKKPITFNQRIEKYYLWPLSYLIMMLIMTIMMLTINYWVGLVFTIITILSCAGGIAMNLMIRKHMMSEILSFALGHSNMQNVHMKHFEIPYIVIEPSGKIRWYNDKFEDMFASKEGYVELPKTIVDRYLGDLIPALNQVVLPSEMEDTVVKTVEVNGKMYRVTIKYANVVGEKVDDNDLITQPPDEQLLYTLYFFDITRETQLAVKNEEQKTLVALLYIDNYDEVIHSIEDVRRPLIVALIDRNISKFAKQVDGVLRKFEKDKYLLVFQKKYLPKLKDDKFTILDTLREINIGNELPVTLSMGIGINDFSYIQSLEFARMAIDLALGRGGDQAVIKNNDKFTFYGGKTRGVEKTTRVKARIKAYAFRELIEESDRVIIMGHRGPDLDSLGAGIGVYACCKVLEKPAHIILNEVTTAIGALHERIVEEGKYPSNIFLKSEEAMGYINENTLLVIVDVNRPSYTETPELIKMAKNVVVFDHHRVSAEPVPNPVLSYIEAYASSTSEMVTEILRYISDKVKLEPVEADALFAGITVDTKNFVVKAGVKTFEAAAFLRRNGADVVRVRDFFKNDMASYKAKATAVRDSEIYKEIMAISVSPSDVANPTLVAAQAADELINISGIKASFVLTTVNQRIYISARSVDNINVQRVMELLNGGGHLNVAGAQLEDMNMVEAISLLKTTIDKYLEEGDKI